MGKSIKLGDLVGEHIFSGVDYIPSVLEPDDGFTEYGNTIIFCLDGINYMMTEDYEDVYRSTMTDLEVTNRVIRNSFIGQPVKVNYIETLNRGFYEEKCDIIQILSLDGQTIMEAGTGSTDDYYPYVVFRYYPENMNINQ